MTTIVLGHDDTDECDRALERAAAIAGAYGARLVVTNVATAMTPVRGPVIAPSLDHARACLAERGLEATYVTAEGDAHRSRRDVLVVHGA